MLICLFVLKWKVFSCRDRHNPRHGARTQRTSAKAQHTASPRQVITNECTLYMAAIIDPETVDGLGGPLGWYRHTENLYRLVQAFAPNSFKVQCPRRFLREKTLKICARVECAPAEPFTNEWVFIHYLFIFWPDIWVLHFLGYLALKGSHISSEKKKHIRKGLGRGTFEHVLQNSGSISQKRREHLDFCAIKCKNHGFAS